MVSSSVHLSSDSRTGRPEIDNRENLIWVGLGVILGYLTGQARTRDSLPPWALAQWAKLRLGIEAGTWRGGRNVNSMATAPTPMPNEPM
jgi:hypothetical protein